MTKKNTAKLWDDLWKQDISKEEDLYNLAKAKNSIRWQRMETIIKKQFGTFKGLKVIEIGAGTGTNAALIAEKGAEVTILDYSDLALKRAKEFFERHNLKAKFVKQDALNLSSELINKYDIAWSFGLTEHFRGKERIQINKSHFDLLKNGGLAFISVPNKFCLPYWLYRLVAKLLGKWNVGEEYPYSRSEFKKVCAKIGVKKYAFVGDSLAASFNLLNPLRLIKKRQKVNKLKPEKGTFLDAYFGYALVLVGFKQD